MPAIAETAVCNNPPVSQGQQTITKNLKRKGDKDYEENDEKTHSNGCCTGYDRNLTASSGN